MNFPPYIFDTVSALHLNSLSQVCCIIVSMLAANIVAIFCAVVINNFSENRQYPLYWRIKEHSEGQQYCFGSFCLRSLEKWKAFTRNGDSMYCPYQVDDDCNGDPCDDGMTTVTSSLHHLSRSSSLLSTSSMSQRTKRYSYTLLQWIPITRKRTSTSFHDLASSIQITAQNSSERLSLSSFGLFSNHIIRTMDQMKEHHNNIIRQEDDDNNTIPLGMPLDDEAFVIDEESPLLPAKHVLVG
jgi:hypothetical protein